VVDDNGVQDFLIASGERILIRHARYKNQSFNDALVSSVTARVLRRICDWRGSVPAAEAKKPMMQAWTPFESPDHLTTPEDWLESTGRQ
jgi:hypothetical protein